jgi:hypothetical protein
MTTRVIDQASSESVETTRDPDRFRRMFLSAWLCSASAVTFVRLLHATDPLYDPTVQIQAAQNLLAGKGLTIYFPAAADLSEPLTRLVLTHFPAGYSLYAAAMLALGIDVATFVKLAGAIATLVGWWGWARLAFAYMGEGLRRSRLWRLAGYSIAILSPVLFTLPWGGTDIILWASIPWVLEWIVRAPDERAQTRFSRDALAGVIVGVCILSRYASVFLAIFCMLAIVGQCRFRLALAARRLGALAAGMLPALVTQGYINFWLSDDAKPGGVVLLSWDRLGDVAGRARDTFTALSGASHGWLFWLPERLQLWRESGIVALILIGILLAVPVLTQAASGSRRVSIWPHDLRIVSAALLFVLPLLLWTFGLFIFNEIPRPAYPRYYDVISPLAVCIAFCLATMYSSRASGADLILKFLSRGYVIAFLLMAAVQTALMILPTNRGESWRARLVGVSQLRPWPSSRLVYESSSARNYTLSALEADSSARLITTREHWFYATPEADPSRIMRWESCQTLLPTHVTGPIRLYFLVWDREPYAELESSARSMENADCLARLPGFRLVRRFPDEGLKLLEVVVPEGVRHQLKPAGDGRVDTRRTLSGAKRDAS